MAPFSSRNVPLQPLLLNNTPHCETQRQSETRARHTGAPGTDPLPSACRNCIKDLRHQQACLSPHKALPKNTGQRQSLSTERPQSITQALSDRLLNRSSHWRNAWCCLLVFVPAVFQESACNNPCGHCPNMLTHSTNNRAWECADYFSDGQNQQLVRLQKKSKLTIQTIRYFRKFQAQVGRYIRECSKALTLMQNSISHMFTDVGYLTAVLSPTTMS